jgi:hypothetical protein
VPKRGRPGPFAARTHAHNLGTTGGDLSITCAASPLERRGGTWMVVVAAVVSVLAIVGALADYSCARRCPHYTAQLQATPAA